MDNSENRNLVAGVSKNGIFWTRSVDIIGTLVTHPKEYYQTKAGLIVPITSNAYMLVETLKKSFELEHLNAQEIRDEMLKSLPPTNLRLACLHVDFNARVWMIVSEEKDTGYVITKLPIPLPEKSFYIFAVSHCLDALNLVSEKFRSVNGLLNFARDNFLSMPNPDFDILYMDYTSIKNMKPKISFNINNIIFKY